MTYAFQNPKMNAGLFTSGSVEWYTPDGVRREIEAEFGPLWDPCPAGDRTGLIIPWEPRVFCNPPYGRELPRWIKKGVFEMTAGHSGLVVFLIPARTDTAWFHDICLKKASEIRFLRRRIRFSGAKWDAPFPSMIVVFRE